MTANYFFEDSALFDFVFTLDFGRFFCFFIGDYCLEFSKLGTAMNMFPAKLQVSVEFFDLSFIIFVLGEV